MPKSRVRRKSVYTPPKDLHPSSTGPSKDLPSPPWYGALLVVMLVIGIAWIVTFYLAGQDVPLMRDLDNWNLVIGFAFMVTGLGLAVRWR